MAPHRLELIFRRHGSILARRVVSPGEYVLGGRGADWEVEDHEISSPHARFIVTGTECFVEDLGSVSGTFIDGIRIASRRLIQPAEKVCLGGQVFVEARRLLDDGPEAISLSPKEAALDRLLTKDFWDGPRYREKRPVAQGGMGAILETVEAPLRRTVAMKVMLDDSTEGALARFIAEARLTGQLEHPNIVPVHEFGIDEEGRLFYTMKYVRGVTLREVLARLQSSDPATLRAFSLSELLGVFQKVCDAIAFAHSRSVVHRDLKPENIMIGDYGEVLVMDWGVAKICREPGSDAGTSLTPSGEANVAMTLDGILVGTPHFMAPEQARGEPVDFRTDVYALGAVLFAILKLGSPVSGTSVQEILDHVRAGRLEPMPRAGTGGLHLPGRQVPLSLAAVVAKAMSVEPGERYQSVAELQEEIRAYRGGFATAAEEASLLKQFWLALGRHKREATILTASLLVLAIGTTLAFLNVARERTRAEDALNDLRRSASAFAEQARHLGAQERFAEGLEKLDYALKLKPETPAYLLARADLLRSMFRFHEAAAAYREAERCGAHEVRVAADALLCSQLAEASRAHGLPAPEQLALLYQTILEEQRPPAELMPVARLLGRESAVIHSYWVGRLKELPVGPEYSIEKRLSTRPDGLLNLNLSGTSIVDLSLLTGMPLAELDLSGCEGIRTIEVIANLPLRKLRLDASSVASLPRFTAKLLEHLSLRNTAISDLSSLNGLPLKTLDCSHTAVVTLSPLSTLPLETLLLDGTPVHDLSVLNSVPLKILSLGGCDEARGYQVLHALRKLETLILPKTFCTLPQADFASIRALHAHPAMRQLAAAGAVGMQSTSAITKEAFFTEWAADFAWLDRCWGAGLSPILVKMPDSTWEFELHEPVRDLSCLTGAPISKLNISSTHVTDLSPLAGMPLRWLDLRFTPVTDISPLAGLPLRELYLHRTNVQDFSALKSLKQLELLDVSVTAFADLRMLGSRQLRELRLGSSKVTDLSPLAGLPLEKIHCDRTPITDLRPLQQCRRLTWLIPPRENCDPACLRDHPSLQRISYEWLENSLPTMMATEFWQEYDRKRAPAAK